MKGATAAPVSETLKVDVGYEDSIVGAGWISYGGLGATGRSRSAAVANGPVARYDLPELHGLNFVVEDALDGGVTTSLRVDSHGKSLSSLVQTVELDLQASVSQTYTTIAATSRVLQRFVRIAIRE
ncbi:DUF1446 domain-containing protein [Halococcus sp. IIIV-5B]|uniref:DUF1446 domain-containing protein n=1 Tax=Halococcus sp. IIIV-5B TaxID=2321230 RepID=UPI0011C3A396|nr:DUF1446 domain-containing protein [Halococcus sp. IIIV-5B]